MVQIDYVPSAGVAAAVEAECISTVTQIRPLERFDPTLESSLLGVSTDSVLRLCLENTPFIQLARSFSGAYDLANKGFEQD